MTGILSISSAIVLGAFAALLFALAAWVFVRRAPAERFFMAFASTPRIHYAEQSVRLLLGMAMIFRAPEMALPSVFQLLGWTIFGTSVALILLPWRWHHAFAQRVLPMVARYLELYAVGLLLFGAFLLYGLVT